MYLSVCKEKRVLQFLLLLLQQFFFFFLFVTFSTIPSFVLPVGKEDIAEEGSRRWQWKRSGYKRNGGEENDRRKRKSREAMSVRGEERRTGIADGNHYEVAGKEEDRRRARTMCEEKKKNPFLIMRGKRWKKWSYLPYAILLLHAGGFGEDEFPATAWPLVLPVCMCVCGRSVQQDLRERRC